MYLFLVFFLIKNGLLSLRSTSYLFPIKILVQEGADQL